MPDVARRDSRRSERAIRVLAIDDEAMMQTMLARELPRFGFEVETTGSGEEGLELVSRGSFDVVVVDMLMPGMDGLETIRRLQKESPGLEVVLLTGHGTIESAVEAMRAGAYDFLTKPCRLGELAAILERAAERRALRRENAALKRLVSAGSAPAVEIVARSAPMQRVLAQAERVATSDAPVLVQGESGTGKELVARLVHERSPRRAEPFVPLNCSAITESLLETELFGHQRGAFTGATERRPGLLEAAHRGTIFLDEIGDMSPSVQAKILRTLDTGEIRRVGENRATHVDVRVVAATNRDLAAEVAAGRFRKDLYYRLEGVVLRVPSLRERPDDIEPLVRHFLERMRTHAELSAGALEALGRHAWPGNVRELRHCVEAVVALHGDGRIERDDLPASVLGDKPASGDLTAIRPLADVIQEYVKHSVDQTEGNKSEAARRLGIDPKTLSRHLRR